MIDRICYLCGSRVVMMDIPASEAYFGVVIAGSTLKNGCGSRKNSQNAVISVAFLKFFLLTGKGTLADFSFFSNNCSLT